MQYLRAAKNQGVIKLSQEADSEHNIESPRTGERSLEMCAGGEAVEFVRAEIKAYGICGSAFSA